MWCLLGNVWVILGDHQHVFLVLFEVACVICTSVTSHITSVSWNVGVAYEN